MEKKKRGRPSLLDLQKRSLQQQQPQQQEQQEHPRPSHSRAGNPNPNPRASPVRTRRSTRRNPDSDATEGDDREEPARLPSVKHSPSLDLGTHASDSNAEGESVAASRKKRKINAVVGGSVHENSDKGEKYISCTNYSTTNQQGTQLDSGLSTPLPNKKLLVFVLDRLQKKDTHGVFSEPVDAEELPDYHEMIAHPMDFGTVRKKLDTGAYANLEEFEKDVFLICSNAMQYNSPDTIFFRQARSIQELAKVNFENLRQDGNDGDPEPKMVRRGRPPTKNLKKSLGQPPMERAESEFVSATPPTSGGQPRYGLRKGPFSDKNGSADLSERVFQGSRKSEAYGGLLWEQKLERNEDLTGSLLKGHLVRHGKKESTLDENRRCTYERFHPSTGGPEPSVLSLFDGEKKQLMAVGLLAEFGYARSLARFAATLGPVAWGIASKKIESSLPIGLKFGPGWVGIDEAARATTSLLSPSSGQLSRLWPLPPTENSHSAAASSKVEIKGIEPSGRMRYNSSGTTLPSSGSISTASVSEDGSSELAEGRLEAANGLKSHAGFSATSCSNDDSLGSQRHRNSATRHGMNGVNGGAYGFKLPSLMGKSVGAMKPTGFHPQSSSPATANRSCFNEPKLSENSSGTDFNASFPNCGSGELAPERTGLLGRLQQQKTDPLPPDLNVMFQSHGEPPNTRVDLIQPDLALQL